jgi:guanosine-3',5'-bis(diphosphate) 3'-pyrophosphohydrolase
VGLLVDISKILSEMDLNVTNLNARLNKKQEATLDVGFRISSKNELEKVIAKLNQVEDVKDITRTRG